MSLAQSLWKTSINNLFQKTLKAGKKIEPPSPESGGKFVFVITSRCNLACAHCMRDFKHASDLPFETAKKVIREGKKYNFNYVCLTGGEPLVYPQIKQLIEFIVSQDDMFSLVTNGILFMNFFDFLKQYKEKISFIAFSLENINKKLHDAQRREGSFETVLKAIEMCRESKIPFRIIATISTMNYNDLFDIVLFAKKKGVQCLHISTMIPCPQAEKNNLVLTAAQKKELLVSIKHIHRMLKVPLLVTSAIRGYSDLRLCSGLNLTSVAVDSEGNLVQCCDLANFDSLLIRQKAIVTSLKDKSFDEAMKIYSEYLHKFNCMRIEDYKKHPDAHSIDFNNCLYCLTNLPRL